MEAEASCATPGGQIESGSGWKEGVVTLAEEAACARNQLADWICHAVISVWHRGVTVRSLPALSREGKRSRPQPTWKRFQNTFVKVSALSSSCLRWAAVWCSRFSGKLLVAVLKGGRVAFPLQRRCTRVCPRARLRCGGRGHGASSARPRARAQAWPSAYTHESSFPRRAW